ncbi:cysteinyl-tRNA synthetase [Oleoguttula sp. CCFEE 5521]
MAQPPWQPPLPNGFPAQKADIEIYNSLTCRKNDFVSLAETVNWYACGPTVYDDAHLGHARNYVSTDIIRRVLQDYFKLDVNFVMNITDVDDKIIIAAREQHVLEQWLTGRTTVDDEVRETTATALHAFLAKRLPNVPRDTDFKTFSDRFQHSYGHVSQGKTIANDGQPPGDAEAKVKRYHKEALGAVNALEAGDSDLPKFMEGASSVLKPYLDSLHGSLIDGSDHHIFTKLTKKYEQRYFEDMASLNVLPPDKLTRVTEYGPQIVDYVKRIQDNGFAYEHEESVKENPANEKSVKEKPANGKSMYYDTGKWEASGGPYARLKPGSKTDKAAQADGEGSLSTTEKGFKRSPADFALWKASKKGEPSWDSPWGKGRPGWHIECSAMASDVLGKQIDIHSGGIDLAFPHHDNEMAQSEAYWCEKGHVNPKNQWVNYFIHMGHLSIEGQKMSKSLKNFTTIRESLATKEFTSRRLRIIFLQGAWGSGLEISKTVKETAAKWEESIENFFLNVNDLPEMKDLSLASNGTNGAASSLEGALQEAQQAFREALQASFDTPEAMRTIAGLVSTYNTAANSEIHVPNATSLSIARWVTEMVHMFGLDATTLQPGQIGWSGSTIPDEGKPFVQALASWRDTVRAQANDESSDANWPVLDDLPGTRGLDNAYAVAHAAFSQRVSKLKEVSATKASRLKESDYLRDTVLWDLDVGLEDRDGRPSLVRPLSARARRERAEAEEKANARIAAKAAKEKEDQEKLEKGKLSPLEMFKTDEYSEWDAEGMPTKDKEGKEIAKSAGKKLRKRWEVQKKAHEVWTKSQAA